MKAVLIPSTEKLFENEKTEQNDFDFFSALDNERFAYQCVIFNDTAEDTEAKISICSAIDDVISVRRVGYVYVNRVCTNTPFDESLFKLKEKGYMPDVLFPIENSAVVLKSGKNTVLFITVDLSRKQYDEGYYPIDIEITTRNETIRKTFTLEIIGASLPKQELIYTNWFHCDSIALTHNVKVFSESFWKLVEKYMLAAARIGMNMILTPIFTPPLDTVVGGERLTVQLVDVEKTENGYSFEFSKLRRFIQLARKCGIKYFEMSHLFTQWGARATPKIVVNVDGKNEKLFGWQIPSNDERYKDFLAQLLPQLVSVIEDEGIANRTFFHLSDEPGDEDTRTRYEECKKMMTPYIKGFEIMDALSNTSFFESGVSTYPIPSTMAVEQFMKYDIKRRWTYYCLGEFYGSNRFIAMNGWNTRAIGVQFFKFNIKGFLQWGFNHFFSILSRELTDPYAKNSKDNFPTGDSFIVYPFGDDVLDSQRGQLFFDALQDERALDLLASKIGREKVIELLENEAGDEITFRKYPKNGEFTYSWRKKVNELIKESL